MFEITGDQSSMVEISRNSMKDAASHLAELQVALHRGIVLS